MDVPGSLAAPSKDRSYQIPKGHYLLASPAVAQIDPTIWKNADTWEIGRWNDNDGVAAEEYKKYVDSEGDKVDYGFGMVSKGTESQYLPFGAGRHRCIGEQVGLATGKPCEQGRLTLPFCTVRVCPSRDNHYLLRSSVGNEDRRTCPRSQLPSKQSFLPSALHLPCFNFEPFPFRP